MSRSQPYRSKLPIQILKIMDVASRITLFLVGQSGPLSFTFKDRLDNKHKTSIGTNLRCSCSPNKNDHCIHTMYVMLKMFKIQPQNPIIWQSAYVDSDLSDILAGRHTIISRKRAVRPIFQDFQSIFQRKLPSQMLQNKQKLLLPVAKAERLQINQDSVCPICQQHMAEDQCLSFCRVKCGNNFHLQCIRIWAEHKATTESNITCPMCRSQFDEGYIKSLQYEQKQYKKNEANKIKIKFKCSSCGIDQIPKNVHKCILCTSFQLCEVCYKNNKHIKHPFIRQCENDQQKWCGAEERREQQLKMKRFIDNKRKQKNVNQQIIEKLRKVEEDPSKLLDFIASAYPYASKYISDNVDPYKKMDLNPEDMRCVKCFNKKMLFLRRMTCGHFIDHECLKQNFRKGRFHCDECGGKVAKGYQSLKSKQLQLQKEKENMIEVSPEFDPKRLEEHLEQNYNFTLPEQATLADILGAHHIQESNPVNTTTRRIISSNLIKAFESRSQSESRHQRTNSYTRQKSHIEGNKNGANFRIRGGPPLPNGRSVSKYENKGSKKSRDETLFEAMISRKIF